MPLNFLTLKTSELTNKVNVRVRLYCGQYESKIDIASRWVHRESYLMIILSNDNDQRKKSRSRIRFC